MHTGGISFFDRLKIIKEWINEPVITKLIKQRHPAMDKEQTFQLENLPLI